MARRARALRLQISQRSASGSSCSCRQVTRIVRQPSAMRMRSRCRSDSKFLASPWTARLSSSSATRSRSQRASISKKRPRSARSRIHPRPRQSVGVDQRQKRLLEVVPRDPHRPRRVQQCPQVPRPPAAPDTAPAASATRPAAVSPRTSASCQARSSSRIASTAARSKIVRNGEVTGIPSTTSHSSSRDCRLDDRRSPSSAPRGPADR